MKKIIVTTADGKNIVVNIENKFYKYICKCENKTVKQLDNITFTKYFTIYVKNLIY